MKLPLAIACLFVVTSCGRWRTPRIYEIPEHFSGWVLVEFGVEGAPPLPQRDGKYIFKLGSDGRLITSSPEEDGFTRDEYFFVGKSRTMIPLTSPGGGGLIWAQIQGGEKAPGKKERVYEIFFVGLEQSVSKQEPPKPR